MLSYQKPLAPLLLAIVILLSCAPPSAVAASSVFQPAAGSWYQPGASIPFIIDIDDPGPLDFEMRIPASSAILGCESASTIVAPNDFAPPIPAPVGDFHGLCTWNSTGAPEGASPLELWIDSGLGLNDSGVTSTVNFDGTVPGQPTGVADGAGPDVDSTTSTGSTSIAWLPGVDNIGGSGVASQDWCVNETADCTATPVRTGSVGGSATTVTTAIAPALVDGSTFYSCIRSVDAAGNSSAYACSDGFLVDSVPPTTPTGLRDDVVPATGTDVDLRQSVSDMTLSWTASTDTHTSVVDYDWCLNDATDCTSPQRTGVSPTATTTSTGSALADGMYYLCARSRDAVGNVSAYACSDGIRIDGTSPTAPASVTEDASPVTGSDLDTTSSTGDLTLSWSPAADSGSGIATYAWCVTTSTDCTAPLRSGITTLTTVSATGAALVPGTTYRACVSATDAAGNIGSRTCSDGIQYVSSIPPGYVQCPTGTSPTVLCQSMNTVATDPELCPDTKDTNGLVMTGTASAETFVGTEGRDCIYGKGGGDTVSAKGGDDVVLVADYSQSTDPLSMTVDGSGGDDLVRIIDRTRPGSVCSVEGGGGADDIIAMVGAECEIASGSGSDSVTSIAAVSKVTAGAGNDRISVISRSKVASKTPSQVDAGAGSDTIDANVSTGTVELVAGSGANRISIQGLAGYKVTAGANDDSLTGSGRIRSVRADLGDGDNVVHINNIGETSYVQAGSGDDKFTIGYEWWSTGKGIFAHTLGDGDNFFKVYKKKEEDPNARSHRDASLRGIRRGSAPRLIVRGGRGPDRIDLGAGSLRSGEGGPQVVIATGASRDAIIGSAASDRIDAGSGDDRVSAGAGFDTVTGGPGNDRLDGGSGRDTIDGGTGADRLIGGAGSDRIFGGPGFDIAVPGSGRDRVVPSPGARPIVS